MSPTINRIINKQFFLYKGDYNPFDGGTPANKVVDDVVKEVERGFEKVGEMVDKLGDSAENFIKDPKNELGQWFNESNRVFYDPVMWLDREVLNNNIDIYSGGLLTDFKNASTLALAGDLLQDKPVDDNLKSTARVGAVVGTAVATGGSSLAVSAGSTMAMMQATGGLAGEGASTKSWENLFGGIAQGAGNVIGGVGKTVGNVINNILNPPDEVVPIWTNDDNPLAGFYAENEDSKKIVLIVALVVSVGILTVALATKKKRK